MGLALAGLSAIVIACAAAAQPRPTGTSKGPASGAPASLRELLATTPADSLPMALRRFESLRGRGPEATEAVLVLGQLHYARGEYRRAAGAFGRAAARLEPARKPEARYWAGLAWLALGESNQARAALDEVATAGGPRQAQAMLAQAQAWELAQRPARAAEVLKNLLDAEPGEAGAAALERAAALAGRDGRDEEARKARERLVREYPRSIEAAAARRAVFSPADPGAPGDTRPGAVAVVIGSFVDPSRARSLASAARAAGFAEARVDSRGQGLAAVHLVRLGVYPRSADARRAGEQAEQALGVTFELMRLR
jgi:tetratricopeptide repeat protein/sporulation related protein